MRLMHTSDWHIGRTFHGHDLLADQEQVLGELARIVAAEHVDAVLVSGDVYDRAVPSADAMQVATRVISDIRGAGASVIAISGNHDSAPRLGVFSDLLAHGGLHLRTAVSSIAEPVVLSDGTVDLAVYAIPFLEPEVVRRSLEVEGPAGHQEVMRAAMTKVREDLARRKSGTRSVVMAHAFVVGGQLSGSERSIAVGGVESIPAEVFDGIDYVALGHLHGRQQVAHHLRYSGSPLPYSFGESVQHKGVWIVDINATGPARARWVELPTVRPLSTIRGTLDELLDAHEDKVEHYIAVELIDPVRPLDPMRRLRERFPYAVTLAWLPDGAPYSAPLPAVTTQHRSDESIVDSFLRDCRGRAASEVERALIAEIVTGLRAREATE